MSSELHMSPAETGYSGLIKVFSSESCEILLPATKYHIRRYVHLEPRRTAGLQLYTTQYYTERRIVRGVELQLGEKWYHVKISLIARGRAVIRCSGKVAHLSKYIQLSCNTSTS